VDEAGAHEGLGAAIEVDDCGGREERVEASGVAQGDDGAGEASALGWGVEAIEDGVSCTALRNVVPDSGTEVKSVAKAIAVLRAFERRGEWGVNDLARELEMPRSVVHRLVRTLVAGGLLDQSGERGSYRLGMGLVRLARLAGQRTTLTSVAHEPLAALAERTDMAAFLSVLRGQRHVCVDVVDFAHQAISVVRVGDTLGLHAGAGGKAILAFQPPSFIDEVLAGPLMRYTERTLVDRTGLLAELEAVRRDGWARSESEVTPGTAAVAAPIRNERGEVVASVDVTTSTLRMEVEDWDAVAAGVLETAAQVSTALGDQPALT
jgi:IclR family transcriptional regulator, acetate operon repressor